MDRPDGDSDHLVVAHDDVPRLVGLAHQVHDDGVVRKVEVEIDLGASRCVCDGIVFHTLPGINSRHAHHELRARRATRLPTGTWKLPFGPET